MNKRNTKRTRLTDWALQQIYANSRCKWEIEKIIDCSYNTARKYIKTNDPQLSHPDVVNALANVLNVPPNTLINKEKT